MALVAIAGPVSNLLMAIGWALLIRLAIIIESEFVTLPLIYTGIAGISINLILALINLIPIPPLDGSRVLSAFLPSKWAWRYNQIERFGFIILMALLWSNGLSYLLGQPMFIAQKLFFSIAGL